MTGNFIDALLGAATPVIMEVKLRNADGVSLVGDRSLADIVAHYEAAGAPCLSVVTGRWFGGTQELLQEVTRLTTLPVLQKDFITKESQLITARQSGASAVLLTAQLLPRTGLCHLIESCLQLGLTPFVEVVSEAEVDAIVRGEDCVVAVNNKDIRRREHGPADLDRSSVLLPTVQRSGTRCPVSASGIDHPETAARLLRSGFAGLLIGTGLLRAGNLDTWMAEFTRHLHQEPRIQGIQGSRT